MARPRTALASDMEGSALVEKLVHIQDVLTGQQLEVLRLRYWDGLTEQEAADRLGISQPRIAQIEAATLDKLRRYKNLEIEL